MDYSSTLLAQHCSEQERELHELRAYKAMREKVDADGLVHQQELESQRVTLMEQFSKMDATKPTVKAPRLLLPEEVQFSIHLQDEDHDPPESEPELREFLAANPSLVWCYVEVRATWNEWVGVMSIGETVCLNEEDFKTNSGYYEDMCKEALHDLNLQIQHAVSVLEPLIR